MITRAACLAVALGFLVIAMNATADDWGAYSFVPASAPALVLEVVGSEITEGAAVSIGKPAGTPQQRWVVVSKGKDVVAIKPSYDSKLVLSAAKGGTKNGTLVVLEAESGKPWQEWTIKKNDSGSYRLIPTHAPEQALDHLGGKPTPGAQIDIWTHQPGDLHLHWFIKPLAGSLPAVGAGESPASSYVLPELKPEETPQGEVKNLTFSKSEIFPGTVRQLSVFIPAQYDPAKPACVYVKTDGYNPREKQLLETLIAVKQMPVTVGVFVRPGDLPAPMKGTLGRRNRCFEYDGVSDNNVRFLVDELLPFVAKECELNLSTSGNDRCIAGGSSGGIAAFTAAWQRPDAFSRVYANSGSFVAFRGGHEFPTMVRKFEAKPIRAFLTTGMRDMENAAGDWYLLDQEMDKALKFSGYDYLFRIINGGHVAGYYENYPEAMAYIWKDWPQPVKAGPSAPRVQDVILPGQSWQLVAENRHEPTGPTCNSNGEVFFAESSQNTIYRIDVHGQVSEFLADAGQANALSFGPEGQLYAGSLTTGKITSYNAAGKGTPIVDGLPSEHLLAIPSGGLFVTSNGSTAGSRGSVWFVKDGKKSQVDAGLKQAAGLAYRPDQWLLSVADGQSKWVYSYQIQPDGTVANKERFFWLHVQDWDDDAGAGAVCYAKEGPMFVATRSGIQVCADDGPTQVILPLPDQARVTAVCLGGKEMDTLYAFSAGKIWKRQVKVHAIGAFSPWTAVNGTKL